MRKAEFIHIFKMCLRSTVEKEWSLTLKAPLLHFRSLHGLLDHHNSPLGHHNAH